MNILIKFGDNDFYHTFIGLLKTLKERYENTIGSNTTKIPNKQELLVIINELSYGHYLLYQNTFEYNEEGSGNLSERTKAYLQITEKQLYIGDEVAEELKDTDWENSEWFYLLNGIIDSI